MKITPIPPDRSAEPPAEPCAVCDMDIAIVIRARGVPFGVERQDIIEYLAAFVEDREPGLHEDVLARMPDIQATVLAHAPQDQPQGRPCALCGDFGYHLDQAKTPCGCKAEGKEAA